MKKFTVNAKALKTALDSLSLVAKANKVTPVLSNIYMKVREKELELIGSDLELTFFYNLPCEAETAPFELLMPLDFLKDVCALTGDAPLKIDHPSTRKAVIRGEWDIYNVSLDKLDDYPKIPTLPKKNSISLNGDFMQWLGASMKTCGKDDQRPAMTKACLNIKKKQMELASTDAHSLFTKKFDIESEVEEELLVSPKVASALKELEKIEVFWHSNHIAFKSDPLTIIATRHSHKFPNYKAIIPKNEANLVLNRNEFINALQRIELSGNEAHQAELSLQLSKEKIYISSAGTDVERNIEVNIPGAYKGSAKSVAFSSSLMLKMLGQIDFETISLAIHSAMAPILITSETDPSYLGLLMPLKINE